MESIVELEISVEQTRLAALFADPMNNPKWMDDLERIEPIDGDLGQPGSTYRLVPKPGNLIFVATVMTRNPFKGLLSRVFGQFAGRAIRTAHRHHLEGFKRFAETSQQVRS